MKNLLKYMCSGLLPLLVPVLLLAGDELRLPAVIGNKMVLQQQSEVPLWGWAQAGKKVRVKADWHFFSKTVQTDDNGKWQLKLKTPKAGGSYQISFKTDRQTVMLDSVLIGEVWLCAGQSNMEMSFKRTDEAEKEIALADHPQIRLFKVGRRVSKEIQDDCKGKWLLCTPGSAADFSGMAYHFGKEIQQNLNVPVGLIQIAWGGVAAEVFMKEDFLRQNPEYSHLFEKWEQWRRWAEDNYAEYDSLLKQWKTWVEQAELSGQKSLAPPQKPDLPEPMYNLVRPHREPAVLYNGMLAPVIPYGIKGVIWCQGISNRDRAYQYHTLFPDLIRHWRHEWQQGEFPFYFVQNPPCNFKNLESAAELREAQPLTMQTVINTGMVVTIDAGDFHDLHPRNKKTPGIRLSNWALAKTYGFEDIPFSGPIYKSSQIKGCKIIITFDYAGAVLKLTGDTLEQFMIAGRDSVFYPAEVKINGSEIEICSSAVPEPVATRYNWFGEPGACLFNGDNLPASPFRTDDWPGVTYGKK